MNKAALAVPVVILLVGAYLIAISLGADEQVAIIPGHPVPTRFGYLLGGLGIIGGLVVGSEMIGKMRKGAVPSSARRADQS